MTLTGNPSDLSSDQLDEMLKDSKSVTEFRILRATSRLLAREGLGISIDAIAVEAELGRRTIFRYFPSRDDLIARALSDSLSRFHAQVAEAISESSDVQQWLIEVVAQLHGSQRKAGAAFWQLTASNDAELPSAIAKVNKFRRKSRRDLTKSIAQTAWVKAGGHGDAPRSVGLAMALSISSFTVQSLSVDYQANDEESVEIIASMLSILLEKAVATQ